MPITEKNYFRYSTEALETALVVMDDDNPLYELIERELEMREAEAGEAIFHSDARDNSYESTWGPGAA